MGPCWKAGELCVRQLPVRRWHTVCTSCLVPATRRLFKLSALTRTLSIAGASKLNCSLKYTWCSVVQSGGHLLGRYNPAFTVRGLTDDVCSSDSDGEAPAASTDAATPCDGSARGTATGTKACQRGQPAREQPPAQAVRAAAVATRAAFRPRLRQVGLDVSWLNISCTGD